MIVIVHNGELCGYEKILLMEYFSRITPVHIEDKDIHEIDVNNLFYLKIKLVYV